MSLIETAKEKVTENTKAEERGVEGAETNEPESPPTSEINPEIGR